MLQFDFVCENNVEYNSVGDYHVPMSKKKPMKTEDAPATSKLPPSRATYRYVYIPEKLAQELDKVAEEQDRSLSYLVKKAVEAYLNSIKDA